MMSSFHTYFPDLAAKETRSVSFLASMRTRRSVRFFSPEPYPFEMIENAVATAGTAPSGANQQPWTFVAVTDPMLKAPIREAAEQEERQVKHYYVQESVVIAVGLLLASLHTAGLVTLTHTPSPMGFLAEILERPRNERAYLLTPVGYPAEDCVVPVISKKTLDEILVWR